MTRYRVHVEPATDGSIPIGLWRRARAETPTDAIAVILRRTHVRAETAYVALGERKWKTGSPMAVQGYRLEWSKTGGAQ